MVRMKKNSMPNKKITEELVKEYEEKVQQMLPALNSGNKKVQKKLQEDVVRILNEIKKKDTKLTALLPILKNSESDSLSMGAASALFDEHEEASLKVLSDIASSNRPMSSTANAIMRQLIARKGKLERWFKNSRLITGLIIASFLFENFSRLFRNIYYGTTIDYIGVALSIFVFVATLWFYRKKIEFGYYYTLFYFTLGFEGALAYFFFFKASSINGFADLFTIPHVMVSGFSEILLLCTSLAALCLLLKELSFEDFKKISTRNDEEIAARNKTDEELLRGLIEAVHELKDAINQKDNERINIAIRDRWVYFNEMKKRDPRLTSLVDFADKIEHADEKISLAAMLLETNEPEAYRLLTEVMERDSTKSSENWHQANNYIIGWELRKKIRRKRVGGIIWLTSLVLLLFIHFAPALPWSVNIFNRNNENASLSAKVLTTQEIQSVLQLLSAWGVSQGSISNIQGVLSGKEIDCTLPINAHLSEKQTEELFSLVSHFGASQGVMSRFHAILVGFGTGCSVSAR